MFAIKPVGGALAPYLHPCLVANAYYYYYFLLFLITYTHHSTSPFAMSNKLKRRYIYSNELKLFTILRMYLHD